MSEPYDWQTRRLRVLRRDGYRCRFRPTPGAPPCLAPASRAGHVGDPDDYSLDNLQARCLSHADGPGRAR